MSQKAKSGDFFSFAITFTKILSHVRVDEKTDIIACKRGEGVAAALLAS